MSKKFARMSRDKRAEMGVGTMIIFIAMVLVAAVAASVLISTANTVREQATQTGNDAINNVASGFDIKYVKGTVASNAITSMDVYVQLSAGSPAIRMDTVTLSVTAGTSSGELTFDKTDGADKSADAGTPATYGAILVPPAAAGTPFASYSTVQQGDLVKITINAIGTADLGITPGTSVTIKIMPAKGSSTTVSFTVPPVLSNGVVNLR
ncbi:MAG: archaellin/type IV pilin N-terminal domain-containing protein [Methanomassiliicoccus sp.]|nr:archaellin/type IV pilin N-terminal domain-containing protein [Methanomassiliicoccus sp.]